MTGGVELHQVGVMLGGRPVLVDISLALAGGESLAVVGPNGSGKSTLLRLLATLLKPASGQGSILGRPITSPRVRESRGRIGLITHSPALIAELTIAENLQLFARLSGRDFEDCLRSLEVVGLSEAAGRKVGESSFGMRRRTEIAWALVAKPDLLLLDEAKSGLDLEAREIIDAMVDLTLSRAGVVVAVSHEINQLGRQFATVKRLESGRLVESP